MAESAVKLLIQNLIPLLAQEATLLEGIHDKLLTSIVNLRAFNPSIRMQMQGPRWET